MAEDGRKNNGGNKNAGRKPLSDELKRIKMMDAIAAPKEAWQNVWKLCEKGNTHALKMWVEYRFGKPKERLDVTTGDESINQSWDLSKLSKEQIQALLLLHDGVDSTE